jgi:EAL domain-containing protein (putative c-di-GMP-specific phosphodiesterase class I)
MGFGMAVDDVGSGVSDLQIVAELRPDYVKVARELARGLHLHDGRRSVVEALAGLTSAMGSRLIVEGVETHEELDALRRMGVDCAQGYLLGLPSPELPRATHVVPTVRPAA